MTKYTTSFLSYSIWTVIAFLLAFGYVRIILGPEPKPSSGFMKIFDWIYEFAFVHIGSMIGCVIAILFILTDVFYLNKRLENVANSTSIRFLFMIIIAVAIGAIHFVLEKVVDVI